MTEAMIQHEHKEFIDKTMHSVALYARLVSLSNESTNLARAMRSELIKEQEEVIEDIENSLYLKLDEVGESE
jgi:ribosome-binding protein aMBF1 (putative translation factor)